MCSVYESSGIRLHATKLKRHLATAHPSVVSKSRDYFRRKLNEFFFFNLNQQSEFTFYKLMF
jgi:hypothetical protein